MSGPHRFCYHRAIAPTMWVLLGLAAIELVVTHLLLSHWSVAAARILSIVSLAGMAWLVACIASFRRRPVMLDDVMLVWRVGILASRSVPIGQVAGLRASWDKAAIDDRSVLNLALVAWPNVVVDLRTPLAGRRGRRITALAHRLDDPAAFSDALVRLTGRHD